ncbi:MAG: alpha/beta hydrolase [Actinobacteria bacterium]|nr:alpha/beta hydrolase [Actinomycetota bacterium]
MKADNDGVQISYEVYGHGRPVILLHGFPDSGRVWRQQVPALTEAGFQVIVPDMRGYGESDHPPEVDAYGGFALATDVVAVMDDLGLDRAHIVGHDWGASVAWVLGSFFPDRMDRLVTMAVGHPATFHGGGFDQYEKSWYMLLFQFPDIPEQWLTENDWARFRAWGQHPDADGVIADLERTESLTPGLNWYRANMKPESFVGPPFPFPKVAAPTLGIWSSEDQALTEGQMTRSAELVDGPWTYRRLDGSGHWMQLEDPTAINALLLDFLPAESD